MGVAYKRNWKNVQGGPDIIGRDVWELDVASLQAPVGATALTDNGTSSRYTAGADARLEGMMLALSSGTLTLGRIGVEVLADGVVVASGELNPGHGGKYITLNKGSQEDVAVASGVVLTANYSVEQSLDTVQGLRVALSLAILEGPEK
jgi:hypothetical protein